MTIKTFEFNPIYENTYIVYDETKECVIIDAGCFYPEEKEELHNFIIDHNLKVKHLLNTHLHFDHIFGNSFVLEKMGVRTKAHKADQFLLDSLPGQLRMFGFIGDEVSPEIDSYLDEGDIISFGNQQLSVIHVPGHSPGSVAFYNEKEKCIFVGDVLFRSSIGRTDLVGGNYPELIDNIRKKLLTLPPETIVYPGHGPITTIGDETRSNPYL